VPKPQKKRRQLRLELDSVPFTVSGTSILFTWKIRKLRALAVERRRQQFEAGEEWALIDAVDLCARGGMAMPAWLADAFKERYLSWRLYRVKTLDEAFGVERPGIHPKRRALREWLRPRIALLMLELHAHGQGMPIDEQIFAEVAAKLNIKGVRGSTVRDIYYESETVSWLRFAGVQLETSK
jgi:hypothetical protein